MLQGHFPMSTNMQHDVLNSARNDKWPAELSHWKLNRKKKVFTSWRNVNGDWWRSSSDWGMQAVVHSWCGHWECMVRSSMVLRLHQHNIGYTADSFYRMHGENHHRALTALVLALKMITERVSQIQTRHLSKILAAGAGIKNCSRPNMM